MAFPDEQINNWVQHTLHERICFWCHRLFPEAHARATVIYTKRPNLIYRGTPTTNYTVCHGHQS